MTMRRTPDGEYIDVPDNPTPKQQARIREIFGEDKGVLRTVGDVTMDRLVKPVAGAASDLLGLGDVKTIFTGTPEEKKALAQRQTEEHTIAGQPRAFARTGMDVATIAGPVAAPGATLAGIGGESGARLYGASPEMAKGIGTAAELITPVAGIAYHGLHPVLAARSRRLVGDVRDLIRRDSNAVSGVFEDINRQAGHMTLDPSDPAYQHLAGSLQEARDQLGRNLSGRKLALVDDMEQELSAGNPVSYSRLEDMHRFLRENLPDPGSVTWSDKLVGKALTDVRSSIRQGQLGAIRGTEHEARLGDAIRTWREEIAPSRKLAKKLETSSPASVAERSAVVANLPERQGIPEAARMFEDIGRTEALRQPGAGNLGVFGHVAPMVGGGIAGAGTSLARGERDPGQLAMSAATGAALTSGAAPFIRGIQTPGGQARLAQLLTLALAKGRDLPTPANPAAVNALTR